MSENENQKLSSDQENIKKTELDWHIRTIVPPAHLIRKSKILAARKDKFFRKIALVCLIFFLLTAGGVTAATIIEGDFYWTRDLLGLGIPKDPREAIEKIYTQMDKLETVHTEMDMDLVLSSEGVNVKIPIEACGDTVFPDKQKVELTVKTKSLVSALGSLLPSDLASDLKEIKIEYIKDDENIYYKIPQIFGELWIEDEYQQFSSGTSNLEDFSDSQENFQEVEKLPSETLDGVRCYHYKITFDTKRFLEDLINEDLTDEEISYLANLKIGGEIWASKKDFLIQKMNMSISFTFPSDVIEQIASIFEKPFSSFVPYLHFDQVLGASLGKKIEGYQSQDKITIFLEIEYSNFNNPINIKKPQKIKKITDISESDIIDSSLGHLLSTVISESGASINDSQRKSDLYQIATALELYANDNSGQYPSFSGTIKIDGKDGLSQVLIGDYLLSMPRDPKFPEYYYEYSFDGDTYELICILEDETDPAGEKVGDRYIFKLKSE